MLWKEAFAKLPAIVTASMCDLTQIIDNRPRRNANLPYHRHHLFNLLILSFGILVHLGRLGEQGSCGGGKYLCLVFIWAIAENVQRKKRTSWHTLWNKEGSERCRDGEDMSLLFTQETEMPLWVALKKQAGLQGERNKFCKHHRWFWRAGSNSGNHQALVSADIKPNARTHLQWYR